MLVMSVMDEPFEKELNCVVIYYLVQHESE